METVDRQGIFDRLKHSIQLLGCTAELQLKLMPDFVCKADEVALDFDLWKTAVLRDFRRDLTEYQVRCLGVLDQSLTELSRLGPEVWTENALRESIEWQRIRALATAVLEAFGWPLEAPPSHAEEYMSGS